MRAPAQNASAFSLVELSIVLVILGLLVGGVLSGQSLIRAAGLRAVTTEYARYVTAAQAFNDKYFALPGDMSNGVSYWGQSTSCGGASATGTCNGNGDGALTFAAAVSVTGEVYQFWRQLASAGLIEGSYTGIAGPGTVIVGLDTIPGTNSARSRLSNAGWGVQNIAGTYGGDPQTYSATYGNLMMFGAPVAGFLPRGAVLKPEEAWNIDSKLDDGRPGTGKVLGWEPSNFANANSCTTSTSGTDFAGTYALTRTSAACSLQFPTAF